MSGGGRRVFAGRGITLPSFRAIAIVVLIAFGAGIAVGWGTGLVADRLAAPEPTVSPSASPTPEPTADVSVPPLEPIERAFEDADAAAGLTSLDVRREGLGTFTVVTSDGQPSGDAASVKWVRVEYEDGLELDGDALSDYVMGILNDPRGWGARGRFEFVPTAGAPDLRVVIASPVTTAVACPAPHTPAAVGAEIGGVTPTPEPTASDDESVPCADQGLVMISKQDWAAGLASFGDERADARAYLVNHFVGHALGDEDGVCASGQALIMTDQADLPEDCDPNPWPWPDEPLPSPTPTPDPAATREEQS